MQQKRLKRRFGRQYRKSQRQFEGLGAQAEENIDRLLFRRFGRLSNVRRFVLSWTGLMILLISGLFVQNLMLSNYYQSVKTVPGGIYNEGVLGSFSNANPIYATSNADSTISRLVFSGLLTNNSAGKLTGDLARNFETDAKGLVYTVHLKPHLVWQDGYPLTSADVLFTYKTIQNPDAQSPLQNSWRDITVTTPDSQTVVFTLPSPLASFAQTLDNGIIPQHILGTVPVTDLRTSDFNTAHPIGSGPFQWKAIQVSGTDKTKAQQQIALLPFARHAVGKPKLDEMVIHVYASEKQMTQAFADNQLKAVQGLGEVPKAFQKNDDVQIHNIPLKAETMVFFKSSSGILSDRAVRAALVQAADVPHIVRQLDYPARFVKEPFLSGQLGYNAAYAQPHFDLKAAKKSLDDAGWVMGSRGVRYKNKRPLMFTLTAADTHEYRLVTSQLRGQWQALGVQLNVQLQAPNDFQTSLANHSYDALLYGISIGTDPDVFVYWDSSQADIRSSNRLNFSEYKNPAADAALESGRTRTDPEIRTFKYKSFLAAWQQDLPALGLYQPRLLYVTHGSIDGLEDHAITTAPERFSNVQNWQIRQAKVTN